MQLRQLRDPGISRRRVQLAHVRVRGQPPDNRVFPPAAADHKYSHAPGAYLARWRLTAAEGHPSWMALAAGPAPA